MSKFRLISKSGDGLALMLRIQDEGTNDCDFWVKNAKAKSSYKNILPQVNDWRRGLTRDTICILDMVGLGTIAEHLKKAGFKVYGGGKLNDRLELDRVFGINIAKISGLKVPAWHKFTSFSKAIEFVSEKGGNWVFKPLDNKSPAFTYKAIDKDDMVEMLTYFHKIWRGKVEFILQERIDGTEVSTECFYVNGDPVNKSLNSTLETKKFLNDDKGPNTGCSTSVVWFWKQANPKIYRLGLKRIEHFLKRFKYNAPLDCNTIISKKDKMPYFIEWTARFGYSAIYALCEGLNMEVGKFIADMASGQIPKLKPSCHYYFDKSGERVDVPYWLGSVRISIPPYPNDDGVAKSADKPIRGLDSLENIWLLDAKFENESLLTAGVDGVVCEVTGKEKTVGSMADDIYSRISKLKIPDAQFRTDIAENANKRLSKLKSWKYF